MDVACSESRDETRSADLMSAMTTEHFVLQTAANGTISEAASRASLYIFSLSSSLVALGFASHSADVLVWFAATILPGVFTLGVLTVIRLIDTSLENQQALIGIARIRRFYRGLSPTASTYFAAETGRWPESSTEPSLGLGMLVAFFGTAASMVACINSMVAGGAVTFLAHHYLRPSIGISIGLGLATAAILVIGFYRFQRWRFATFSSAIQRESQVPEI
jgi:hypothetical protein